MQLPNDQRRPAQGKGKARDSVQSASGREDSKQSDSLVMFGAAGEEIRQSLECRRIVFADIC